MLSSTGNAGGGVCPACGSPVVERKRYGFGWIAHTHVCSNEDCTHYFPVETKRDI